MSAEVHKYYRAIKRVKSDKFSIDDLHEYSLSLSIGNKAMQVAVINSGSSDVMFIEEFKFENIKTIKTRIMAIKGILESHHFLRAGFWKSVSVALKTHKFSLIPDEHFAVAAAKDYLVVNSALKNSLDEVLYYHHEEYGIYNVFAGDKLLINWLKKVYPKIDINFIHQGSALIEGIHQYKGLTDSKTIFGFFDRGVLHILATEKKQLIYYNQFAIKNLEDYPKYVILVFRELGVNHKEGNFIIWGNISNKSQHFVLLKKYIRNIHFGGRNQDLKFSYHFDEIADHQYFDLLNMDSTLNS